jgi:hypothetical protein
MARQSGQGITPFTFSLQRLAASDPEIANVLVVDVAALCLLLSPAHHQKYFCAIAEAIREAAVVADRAVIWAFARPPGVPELDGFEAAREIINGVPDQNVIGTQASLEVLLNASVLTRPAVSIVTASVSRRASWMLACGARSLIDIVSGVVWTPQRCVTKFGMDPELVPYYVGLQSVANRIASSPRVAIAIAAAVQGDSSKLPRHLRKAWNDKAPEIDDAVREIHGRRVADEDVAAFSAAVSALDGPEMGTLYLVPELATHGTQSTVTALTAVERGRTHRVVCEDNVLRFFDECAGVYERWFSTAAVLLGAWLVQNGRALPPSIVDPAWAHVALCGDADWLVSPWPRATAGLSPRAQKWLTNPSEAAKAPTDFSHVANVLPLLDRQLRGALQSDGLLQVVEDDLGRTLPVLSKVQACGHRILLPPGCDNFDKVFEAINRLEVAAATDAAKLASIVGSRHVADGFAELGSAGTRILRCEHLLTTNGRLVTRAPSLHAMIKDGPLGELTNAMLGSPVDGCVLKLDLNAFEARVAAAVFNDERVLALCVACEDLHQAVANHVYRTKDASRDQRTLVKSATWFALYGGQPSAFGREHGLADTDLRLVWRRVRELYSHTLRGLRNVAANTGERVDTGGWHRYVGPARKTPRRVRSTYVQAAAATAFRWLLREANVALQPLSACIGHHEYDALLVYHPEGSHDLVQHALEQVLRSAAEGAPALSQPLHLRASFKRGKTWADVR